MAAIDDAPTPRAPTRPGPSDRASLAALVDQIDALAAREPESRSLAIANGIAQRYKRHTGQGPTNTRTTITADLVVCLLEGGFTRAERTLATHGSPDLVIAGRRGLHEAMRAVLIDLVQSTLDRRVQSLMSTIDLQNNLQIHVFTLHPESSVPDPSNNADVEASTPRVRRGMEQINS